MYCNCWFQSTERDGPDLLGNQGHGVDARWIKNCQDQRCDGTLYYEGLQTGRH